MRIGLVYERKEWFPFREGDPQDINSELLSAEEEAEIVAGLEAAGHQVLLIGDARRLVEGLSTWRQSCDLVFNRSVGYRGTERKSIAAAILDAAGMPYVGSSAYVLSLTRNKHHCKLIAEQAGLRTPSSAVLFGGLEDRADAVAYPAIIKPIAESSSIGIEAGLAVVENPGEARRQAQRVAERYAQPVLVETFIEGIEVEVPMMADAAGDMRVFGMAMVAVDDAAPQGCHYLASDSVYVDNYGYLDPPACVDAAQLAALAERGARALGIRDYGRLDFRIDNAGRMWFIEASTHPHVQVHSSFNHAAGQRKESFAAMLDEIIQAGWRRHLAGLRTRGGAIG